MRRKELDIALLPVIELARIAGPGDRARALGSSRGRVALGPADFASTAGAIRRVALDPESRTSNALVRVLFAEYWKHGSPEFVGRRGRDLAQDARGTVSTPRCASATRRCSRAAGNADRPRPGDRVDRVDRPALRLRRLDRAKPGSSIGSSTGCSTSRADAEGAAIDRIAEDYTWRACADPEAGRGTT